MFAAHGGRTQAGIDRRRREEAAAARAAETKRLICSTHVSATFELALFKQYEERPVETRSGTLRRIVAEEAKRHGCSYDEVMSDSRKRHVVDARFASIVRARQEFPGVSVITLGDWFNRNHSSILHCLKQMEARA